MVNTYAVQSGGCRFEPLRGFGFCLKGAHYEVDYCGKKTFLAGLQCTLTSSCAKKTGKKHIFETLEKQVFSRFFFSRKCAPLLQSHTVWSTFCTISAKHSQWLWPSTLYPKKASLKRWSMFDSITLYPNL